MEHPLTQVYVVKAQANFVKAKNLIAGIEGVFATLDAAKAYCEWGAGFYANYHDGLEWTDVGAAGEVYWWRCSFKGGKGEPIYFIEPHRVWFDGETE